MYVSSHRAPRDCPTVDRIARELVAAIDGALHAAVSIVIDGRSQLISSTNTRLDVEHDDGPTAAVALTGRIRRVPSVLNNAGEFPSYVAECKRAGVSSVAAVPVKSDGVTIGVLTVTSADHHGFGPNEIRASRRSADLLAAAFTAEQVLLRRCPQRA